ncbi:MAG TPA: amino acid permease [Solirubrobacteraceae bacterium]|jgi:APA family basic amino acid/polyamine antiporter|nr:amino acid permease [Solirubrobacteraceae bacterium]
MPDRPRPERIRDASSRLIAGAAHSRLVTSASSSRLIAGSARSGVRMRRSLGSPQLFAIVWTSLASAIYFSLGVIAHHALGLTPLVFLIAGLYFIVTGATYVEGASLHQDRAGSTVFARYAFNELVSFVAGWAILLDYVILIAVTALSATHYLAAFWAPLGRGSAELVVAFGIILYVAVRNVRGFSTTRTRRIGALVVTDLALQLLLIVIGLVLFFNLDKLTSPIHLGSAPRWSDLIFALTVGTVAFTSLESASGLAGEVGVTRRGLRRLLGSAAGSVLVVYVGIALVAVTALPVVGGHTPLGDRYVNAPVLGIVARIHPVWLSDALKFTIAAAAVATLVAAANSAMLGLSRLAYSLATNRQIPSRLGALHPRRFTPFVLIAIAALIAAALVAPADLEFLVGIYAFGALLAFTIAHLSIITLRYREPDRDRPYRIPFSLRFRGGDLPLPALIGALASVGAWVSVLIFHGGARYVGSFWMLFGLALYVIYRKTQGKTLLRRITVPAEALRAERSESPEGEYGSVLVPLFAEALDDDIVQTAARLVSAEQADKAELDAATIEALWVFEIPMSLPIDARLPEAQLKLARSTLARAKEVGEEYAGVEVATATVRARRAGQAIVEEARRRGVEAIVLAAEEPSRIRGGALLGGLGGSENFVGEVTKYVVTKASCRVILTAPPSQPLLSQAEPAGASDPDSAGV